MVHYAPPVYNYIGSKINLLGFIQECIESYTACKLGDMQSVADAFCGTGAVTYMFLANNISRVVSNDLQKYAYIMTSTIDTKALDMKKLCVILGEINNEIKGDIVGGECDFIAGSFTELGPDKRKYFTETNGLRIDKARQFIEAQLVRKRVGMSEYNFLLKCLLHAVIKVSNITCVYGAYLKAFKEAALQDLQLISSVDELKKFVLEGVKSEHMCYNKDVFDFLADINGGEGMDIVYLDPPYSTRRYDTSYHLLETISLYDRPTLRGKTGLRPEPDKSHFSSKTGAYNDFEKLFQMIKSKYVFLSYSSDGNVSRDDMITIMSKYFGDVKCYETYYKRVKTKTTENSVTQPNVKEYIFAGKLEVLNNAQVKENSLDKNNNKKSISESMANICDEIANIASVFAAAFRNGDRVKVL